MLLLQKVLILLCTAGRAISQTIEIVQAQELTPRASAKKSLLKKPPPPPGLWKSAVHQVPLSAPSEREGAGEFEVDVSRMGSRQYDTGCERFVVYPKHIRAGHFRLCPATEFDICDYRCSRL